MNDVFLTMLEFTLVGVLIITIFIKPYLGIVFTMVSLPVVDLLPEIPLLSSIVVLIGAVTLVGYFIQRKQQRKPFIKFGSIQILGLLFVCWIFISNPFAAWFGISRNWVLTFFQLWVLIWLTGELLDSPQKQQIFMWIFSIVSAISAITAILQGNIGDTIGLSYRAGGLAGQPNASGRYFVIAMIFFTYLSSITKKRFPHLLAIAGIVVTFLGVFFTLSRTSILLLIIALGLQIILKIRKKSFFPLLITYFIAALVLYFLSDKVFNIIKTILPSITQGTDTIGLRYELWQAAWRMWLDHIFQGVGIGMFPANLRFYAPYLPSRYWDLGAHNSYLMVLSETGLIGFALFSFIIIIALKNYWHSSKKMDIENIALRNVWLVVFLITLIGGMTLNGQNDKMLWFLFGASIYFRNQSVIGAQTLEIYKQPNKKSQEVTHSMTDVDVTFFL